MLELEILAMGLMLQLYNLMTGCGAPQSEGFENSSMLPAQSV